MSVEFAASTPVRVRIARTEADRARVFALRARALPVGGAPLSDHYDRLPNATLLMAESVQDGELLGTLRILSGDCGPLMVDGLVELPASLKHRSIAEGSRLVVPHGRNAQHVRRMLWKAFHRNCLAAQLQTMLIAACDAAADEYESLGFTDVLPDGALFAPRGRDRATHRLLHLGVFEAHEVMQRSRHPLHQFFFLDRHPEIDLLAPAGSPSHASSPPRLSRQLYIAAGFVDVAVV